MLFVRVIKDVKGVREKPSLIGVELHPAAILRGLTTSRPTSGQSIVDRARIVFTTGVKIPQVGEVERDLVEDARPDLVTTVVPGMVGAQVKRIPT